MKAILREMKAARVSGRLGVDLQLEQGRGSGSCFHGGSGDDDEAGGGSAGWAAIWVVDPRSLAEGMSSSQFKVQ